MRILVVDGDPEILQKTQIILEGYEIHTATTGPVAIEMAQSLKPDLILLDVNPPDLDGYEVCQAIKQDMNDIVKIIFMSAAGEIENRIKGYNCGADDYLTKPLEKEATRTKLDVFSRVIDIEKNLRLKTDHLKSLARSMSLETTAQETENVQLNKLSIINQCSPEIIQSIQNNLIAVRGYSSILKHKHKEDYLFSKIVNAIDAAEELLRSTMTFDHNQQKTDLDIRQIITDEIRFLNLNLNFKTNIKVYSQFGETPLLYGIRSHISQAVHSLLNMVFESSRKLNKPVITIQATLSPKTNSIQLNLKQADSSGPFQRDHRPEEKKELEYIQQILHNQKATLTTNSRENENYSFTIDFPLNTLSKESITKEEFDKAV